MNLTEHYKQILREFVGPGVHADAVEGALDKRGKEISQDQFEQIALQRSYRLAKLQKIGRKAATSVIKSIGDKKLLKMFRQTQIGIKEPPVWPDTEQGGRKTLSRIDAPKASNPAGSVQDVRKAIEIAKAIEAHANGGIRLAHDFMRAFHTYHMSTPFADPGYHAGGDPFMTGEVKRRVRRDPNTGEVTKTRYVHDMSSEYPNADVAKGTIYYPYKPGTRPRPSGLAHFGPEWEGLHRSAEDLMKGRPTEQTEEHYRKSLQMSRAYLNELRARLDAHEGQ